MALLWDDGVLLPEPTLCWQCWRPALMYGGSACLHWRADALAAQAAGVSCFTTEPAHGCAQQAVVYTRKEREASWNDVVQAWNALPVGGRLVLVGGNDTGIKTTAKICGQRLGVEGIVVANRARARACVYSKITDLLVEPTFLPPVVLSAERSEMCTVVPGVFSARGLDGGTALLLDVLSTYEGAVSFILDVACGVGHLGLNAVRQWPMAEALLLDADARAVSCAAKNGAQLTPTSIVRAEWWDTSEAIPSCSPDLILINPPFHTGVHADMDVAKQMFQRIEAVAQTGAVMLVVANRHLPWERELEHCGHRQELLSQKDGYKIIRVDW